MKYNRKYINKLKYTIKLKMERNIIRKFLILKSIIKYDLYDLLYEYKDYIKMSINYGVSIKEAKEFKKELLQACDLDTMLNINSIYKQDGDESE